MALTGAIALAAIGTVVGTIYSSNRRLQYERDIAIAATQEAKTQRTLAEKRLDKAIEAVDQMMVRTASERWATRPELQEERQRVLEDAVAFYGGFGDESGKDERVQNEYASSRLGFGPTQMLIPQLLCPSVRPRKHLCPLCPNPLASNTETQRVNAKPKPIRGRGYRQLSFSLLGYPSKSYLLEPVSISIFPRNLENGSRSDLGQVHEGRWELLQQKDPLANR